MIKKKILSFLLLLLQLIFFFFFCLACDLQRGLAIIIDSTAKITENEFQIQVDVIRSLLMEFEDGRLFLSVQIYHEEDCSGLKSNFNEGFHNINTRSKIESRIGLLEYQKSKTKFNLTCFLQIYTKLESTLPVSKSEKFGFILTQFESVRQSIPESMFTTYDPYGMYYVALLYNSPKEPEASPKESETSPKDPETRWISKRTSNTQSLVTELMYTICCSDEIKSSTDIRISKQFFCSITATFSSMVRQEKNSEIKNLGFVTSAANNDSESSSVLLQMLTSKSLTYKKTTKYLVFENPSTESISYTKVINGSGFHLTESSLKLLNYVSIRSTAHNSSYQQPTSSEYDPILVTSHKVFATRNENSNELSKKSNYKTLNKLRSQYQPILTSSLYKKLSVIMVSETRSLGFSFNTNFGGSKKLTIEAVQGQTVPTVVSYDAGRGEVLKKTDITLSKSVSFNSQMHTEYSDFKNVENIKTPLLTSLTIFSRIARTTENMPKVVSTSSHKVSHDMHSNTTTNRTLCDPNCFSLAYTELPVVQTTHGSLSNRKDFSFQDFTHAKNQSYTNQYPSFASKIEETLLNVDLNRREASSSPGIEKLGQFLINTIVFTLIFETFIKSRRFKKDYHNVINTDWYLN